MGKPTLAYWDIRGYGQPLRFLLAHLGVDYTDKIYKEDKRQEYFDEKFNLGLDFPNLPYWIDSEAKLTEKWAIGKYLSQKYDTSLLPEQSKVYKAEMLQGVIEDLWNLLAGAAYYAGQEQTEEFKEISPKKLAQVEKFIGKFALDDQLTYVDFFLYEMLYHYQRHDPQVFKDYPILQNYLKNFESLPKISSYISNNKEVVNWTAFSNLAKIKF